MNCQAGDKVHETIMGEWSEWWRGGQEENKLTWQFDKASNQVMRNEKKGAVDKDDK